MKTKTRPALCLLLALLTACISPGTEILETGTASRHPAAAVSFWERDPEPDHGFRDLRGADLRGMDLSDRAEDLFAADFDTRTQWPEAASLPEDFDPSALLYFIADDVGTGSGKRFVRDMTYYAGDVDRFVSLNETLPEGEKIRVISMSVGWMPDTPGRRRWRPPSRGLGRRESPWSASTAGPPC